MMVESGRIKEGGIREPLHFVIRYLILQQSLGLHFHLFLGQ